MNKHHLTYLKPAEKPTPKLHQSLLHFHARNCPLAALFFSLQFCPKTAAHSCPFSSFLNTQTHTYTQSKRQQQQGENGSTKVPLEGLKRQRRRGKTAALIQVQSIYTASTQLPLTKHYSNTNAHTTLSYVVKIGLVNSFIQFPHQLI